MYVSKNVKSLSNSLSIKASIESDYYPIDRIFLTPYISFINEINAKEFIYYNLENNSSLYTNQLFLCLPELWTNLQCKELLSIITNLTTTLSYFTLIEFTYKYIEVDILETVIKVAKKKSIESSIREYLFNQYSLLIKSDDEIYELTSAVGKNYFHYNYDVWNNIKARLITECRFKRAVLNQSDLHRYLNSLYPQS